jgi:hypothetical protein
MVFLLLSRFGFSDEVPGCRDPGLLMCNRLMVGTTYIDLEVTSSERYGLMINVDILMNFSLNNQCAKFQCKVML